MKRVLSALIGIGILVFTGLLIVHAQAAPIDLSISTFPLNPDPGQQVTVTVQSYSTDITQANISWTYNGKTIATNIGQNSVTVTAPAAGGTGTITVSVSSSGFDTSTSTLVLRPGSVDMLWEGADSYTPPFYEGRALPSAGGIIRVTAVPSASAPSSLSYTWTQNDNALQSLSGNGKSSIIFRNDTLDPQEDISVTESNGGFSGQNNVTIVPGSPSIVGYLVNNGYIDYANGSNTALSTTGTGAIAHFEPFFFSASGNINKNLSFSYTDNGGNDLPAGDSENELRLSAPDSGNQSQFNISVGTVVYSLQNLTVPFSVNFN